MTTDLEFLQNIKHEIDTAEYGGEYKYNLYRIGKMLEMRIIEVKKLSKVDFMRQLKELIKYVNEEGANASARSKQYKNIEQIEYFQGGKAFAYFDIARRMKKLLK